jgi:acyl-CoA thioester hydrolase
MTAEGMRGPAVTVRGRVEWMDTDAAGVHHNTAITRFAESAEAELMRRLGIDGYFESAPRVRFEVSYEAPLRFGQEVSTVLRVERVGTSSLTLGFEVWGEERGDRPRRRAATGKYVTVHVPGGVAGRDGQPHEGEQTRSAPWPAAWLSALSGAGSVRPHRAGSAPWSR